MKRIFAFILTAMLVFVSIPLAASAAEAPESIYVGGVEMTDGDYLAIASDSVSATKPEGGYAYYKNGVLTLHNYEYTGVGVHHLFNPYHPEGSSADHSSIYSVGDLSIIVEGENYLVNTGTNGKAVTVLGNLTVDGDADALLSAEGMECGFFVYGINNDTSLTFKGANIISKGDYCAVQLFVDSSKQAVCTIDGACLRAESDGWGVLLDGVADGNVRLHVKSGSLYANIVYEGLMLDGYHSSEVIIDGGTVDVHSSDGYGIYTYCESQASPLRHNGGEVLIEAGFYAVRADKTYLNGDKFTASSNINGNQIFATLFLLDYELSDELTVVEGSFEGYYVKAIKDVKSSECGDVNNDGAIDQYDYLLVKRHYFETRYLTADEMTRADANNDGEVNQFDYILIKRHYFGTFTIS